MTFLLCSMRSTGPWARSSKLSNHQGYKFVFLTADNGYVFSLIVFPNCVCSWKHRGWAPFSLLPPFRPDLNQGIRGGNAGPFRCGKGSTWEGGFRAPGIAWWPNKIKHGRTHQVNNSCTVAVSEWQLPVPTITTMLLVQLMRPGIGWNPTCRVEEVGRLGKVKHFYMES